MLPSSRSTLLLFQNHHRCGCWRSAVSPQLSGDFLSRGEYDELIDAWLRSDGGRGNKVHSRIAHRRERTFRAISVVGAIAMLGLTTSSEIIVLPPIAEDSDGTGSVQMLAEDAIRMQSVFDTEMLTSEMPAGAWINGIGLRVNRVAGPFSLSIDSIQVSLSTTPVRAGGLSWTFSENLGPDVTQVAFAESLAWDFNVPESRVMFTPIIPFDSPFFYNPAAGSLLVDVVVRNPSENIAWDYHGVGSHEGSGFFVFHSSMATPDIALNPNRGDSPVLRLDFQSIPEPASIWLAGMGIVLWLVHARVRVIASRLLRLCCTC